MKVMVTKNIEIDLDLTNGAQGEIVDIILHPDEPPIGNAPVVHASIHISQTFKIKGSCITRSEANVVPIEPVTTSYRIKIQQ